MFVRLCVSSRGMGVKPAGSMKSNLTTLFRQHIPLLLFYKRVMHGEEEAVETERAGE